MGAPDDAALGRQEAVTLAPRLTTVDASPRLRAARPDEAGAITELALRSKRLWGYDDEFMRVMTPVMTLTPSDIGSAHVEVLEADGRLLGFLRLEWREDHAWLEDLFVEPALVRQGHGRRLFERAVELARDRGYERLRLESDPHAEAFYLALGAVRIGMSPNEAIPGRIVPLMEVRLADELSRRPAPG